MRFPKCNRFGTMKQAIVCIQFKVQLIVRDKAEHYANQTYA